MTTDTLARRFAQGQVFLAEQGLNLLAVFDCASEPLCDLQNKLSDKRLEAAAIAGNRLILIGNAGPAFWRALQANANTGSDPVDNYSHQLAKRFVEEYLYASAEILYPGAGALPLQYLGALAGWHYPSPLGVGIHPQYGLWFAYRAAVLTDAPLAPSKPLPGVSPCQHCTDRPCLSACPPRALAQPGAPDLRRCLDWRCTTESSCANTCLARLACPVGREQRYDEPQIQYHYGHSLQSLKRWQTLKN